ncbi:MAG: nucleotide-binding protein [Pseudomonadota bacterium]
MPKPSLFVGSSKEGLPFARAIRSRLMHDTEVTLWDEGFFSPGSTFIETLVNSLPRFDFAVLVLTPDDWVRSRNDETLSPRDNVVFELGLFMGRLGRLRTFMVLQADAGTKIPTDLAGVTMAQYCWPREDMNYEAAVGAACDSIRRVVEDLGLSEEKASQRIQVVAGEQQRQRQELDWIKTLIDLLVSDYERMHLDNFASDGPFIVNVRRNSTFRPRYCAIKFSQIIPEFRRFAQQLLIK